MCPDRFRKDYPDGSKEIVTDFGTGALGHHEEGCFAAETLFGLTIPNPAGRQVPVRLIAEQHVLEDPGRIPPFADDAPWRRYAGPQPLNAQAVQDFIADGWLRLSDDRREVRVARVRP